VQGRCSSWNARPKNTLVLVPLPLALAVIVARALSCWGCAEHAVQPASGLGSDSRMSSLKKKVPVKPGYAGGDGERDLRGARCARRLIARGADQLEVRERELEQRRLARVGEFLVGRAQLRALRAARALEARRLAAQRADLRRAAAALHEREGRQRGARERCQPAPARGERVRKRVLGRSRRRDHGAGA
jgi:hypothetical protein